jgi:CheY-like chemotaxis protein
VKGDFHQLQQVFLNLVTNAQQALKESEGPKRLSVRSSCADGRVRVDVEDSGPGIEQENMDKVFDAFFTTKEAGKGTGLGLSLALETIRSHGGSITVRSDPGSGTHFTVELPPATSTGSERPRSRESEAPGGPVPSRSILVVEDEENVSRFVRDALTADGHRVETAIDGAEARDRIARREYDLIITDLRMPKIGGRQLYEETSSTRPELARRFIFATGDVLSGEARDFFEKTGRPVLAKPFDVNDLRRLVREALHGSRSGGKTAR